jgi:sugar lactone lactonase YvrE
MRVSTFPPVAVVGALPVARRRSSARSSRAPVGRVTPCAPFGHFAADVGAHGPTCGSRWQNLIVTLLMLAGGTAGWAQPLNVSTLAGQALPGSADGPGQVARFNYPNGVAADAAGNVFVADTANDTIRKITPEGLVSTLAGSPGQTGSADGPGANARFFLPQGIAVDDAGNLYVADTGNSTIRKITPAGMVTTLAGAAGEVNSLDGSGSEARFNQPQALAVDAAGNVFVADTMNHTIRVITPAGQVSTLAGRAGDAGSADGANSRARFNRPAGMAHDGGTNLFVTDFLNHTIRRITPDGGVSTIAGAAGVWGHADGTNRTARFLHPQGIVAAGTGTLFVVDSGNQTLRKITAVGSDWVVSTAAGFAGRTGNRDDFGAAAQLFFPAGAALDGAGRFYFADLGNNSIRTDRFVPPVLRILLAGSQGVVSWPASASAFELESAPAMAPGGVWTPLTNGVTATGDGFVFTNAVQPGAAFYRLRR